MFACESHDASHLDNSHRTAHTLLSRLDGIKREPGKRDVPTPDDEPENHLSRIYDNVDGHRGKTVRLRRLSEVDERTPKGGTAVSCARCVNSAQTDCALVILFMKPIAEDRFRGPRVDPTDDRQDCPDGICLSDVDYDYFGVLRS